MFRSTNKLANFNGIIYKSNINNNIFINGREPAIIVYPVMPRASTV